MLADPADVRLLAAALAPGVVVLAHEEPGYEHPDWCRLLLRQLGAAARPP